MTPPPGRHTCERKTARGNCFRSKGYAVKAARRLTRQKGEVLGVYWCPCCGHYHVGKTALTRKYGRSTALRWAERDEEE